MLVLFCCELTVSVFDYIDSTACPFVVVVVAIENYFSADVDGVSV